VKKWILFFLCLGFLGFGLSSKSSAEDVSYAIDARNHFSLASSIRSILQFGSYPDHDVVKFYMILKEIELGTQLSSEALLLKYSLPYFQSNQSGLYFPIVAWKYIDSVVPYDPGFDEEKETKRLVVQFTQMTESHLLSGTIRLMSIPRCPRGWLLLSKFGFSSSCAKAETGTGFVATSVAQSIESKTIIRYLSEDIDQSIYGFHSGYNPKFTFTYQRKISSSKVEITLIDFDKLVLKRFEGTDVADVFFITKDFHHRRNQFQVAFDPKERTFLKWFSVPYGCSLKSAYFHQIATFNGDTSNLRNKKYVCRGEASFEEDKILESFPLAASEVVYTKGGALSTNHVVYGTFNFSVDTEEHYLMDVYPYLIFGNSPFDTTTLRERLIWDYDARKINLFADLRKWRDPTLSSRFTARIHPSLAHESTKDAIATHRMLNERLSWQFAGFSGVVEGGFEGCGGFNEPSCSLFIPY